MRYTTVIDVTEIADVWQNPNISRLYFFMALKCGYHDDDRDILKISLRSLAAQASLTLSATRHALKVLETAKLVAHEKEAWRVTKFVLDKKPTSRTQKTTATMSASEESADKARAADMKKEEELRMKREFLHNASASEIQAIIDKLNERKPRPTSVDNIVFYYREIENLQEWISFKKKRK